MEPRCPSPVAGQFGTACILPAPAVAAACGTCPYKLPASWCCSQQPADMPHSDCVIALQEALMHLQHRGMQLTSAQCNKGAAACAHAAKVCQV